MRTILSTACFGLALLAASLVTTPNLSAQCPNCCKNAPDTGVAKAKVDGKTSIAAKSVAEQSTKSTAKTLPLLYNDQCPVTGLPTGPSTPTIEHAGYRVSLCCNNCRPLFAKLDGKKTTAFLAKFTGEHKRAAFPKPAFPKAVAKTTTKSDCCPACADPACCTKGAAKATPQKPKADCCEDTKAQPAAKTVKADCCEAGKTAVKTAAKPDCCEAGKTAVKPDCCEAGKTAVKTTAKPDCCEAGKTAVKAAAKPDCCEAGQAAAAKPTAKAECCESGKATAKEATKPGCCAAAKSATAPPAAKPAAKPLKKDN